MPTTTLSIDGSPVVLAVHGAWPVRLTLRAAGIPTLTLQRRGGPTIKPADSWLGKTVELSIDGNLVFAGDVVDLDHQWSVFGWVALYQCRGLRWRGDLVPLTDENTLTDSASFNLQPDDVAYLSSRAGRTVGEIIKAVLTMDENAAALDALGIGGYTSLSPPTLPSETLADLAALSDIPPQPVAVSGGKLLSATESYLSSAAPNHAQHVRADGVILFKDMRDVTENVLTLGTDLLEPPPLKRSVANCFQRVLIRGMPIAEPQLLTLRNGDLEEDFAWGAFDNAAAKAAWTPADYDQDLTARSQGSCSCTDTVTVVLTSDPTTQTWGADELDQDHRKATLLLSSTVTTGVNKNIYKKVVSNTSKSSGGTSTATLESALPETDYDTYTLYCVASEASYVYRKYKIADEDIAAKLARQFTYPVVWMLASGDVGTSTTFPAASVCWSISGDPPYNEVPVPFSYDQEEGTIIFTYPTYNSAGGQPPDDVRFLAAVNTGELTVVKPDSGYEGTSHTVEGLERTLVVTIDEWRDPANATNMAAYAQSILDSVKNTEVEGQVTVNGLYAPALTIGNGVSITGDYYTTGWEGLNLPIVEASITWNDGAPSSHTTTLYLSNRRSPLSDGQFLRPSRLPGGQDVGIASAQGNADESNRSAFGDNFGEGNWKDFQKQAQSGGISGSTMGDGS